MIVTQKRIDANRRNFAKGRAIYRQQRKAKAEYNNEMHEHIFICEKCGVQFTKSITNRDYDKHKWPRHCSRRCANSRERTEEFRATLRAKLSGVRYINGVRTKPKSKVCKYCQAEFQYKPGTSRVFCSDECKQKYMKVRRDTSKKRGYIAYKNACAFKFNLGDYPDEFDFELIRKYGWYQPTNRGNHPGGVTRDHIFSIFEGFKENISPDIISHPANCRLLLYAKNVSKNKKCDITIDELKERICRWELKYGKYK